ncbi:hypothetical protein BKA64DRAFT_706729 [Cadophora sp. MPI-SDFR-AT-0126]|nr:hypothetical protein BKA64DRAFT_706729 [Leotiomycetes sp. MPI-SDFR-AT-0126]
MATWSRGMTVTESAVTPASYKPCTHTIRTVLNHVLYKTADDRKEVLWKFDLLRGELSNLMVQEGFFPGFTQAQKLWYIDATLHETFPPQQLPIQPESLSATFVEVNTNQISNNIVAPRKFAKGLRNASPSTCQDVAYKTGVDWVTNQAFNTTSGINTQRTWVPENNVDKETMDPNWPIDFWAVPSRSNNSPVMANRQQDTPFINGQEDFWSGGSRWGASSQQPILKNFFPDGTTESSSPHLSSSQQDFMSIHFQGNSVQLMPPDFRGTPSPFRHNTSPGDYIHQHSFTNSAN